MTHPTGRNSCYDEACHIGILIRIFRPGETAEQEYVAIID